MRIDEIIRSGRCTIVDVRSVGEFETGHAPGSINIPLYELPDRLEEIKTLQGPLVLCCASGNRSGQARYFLSDLGIECLNGGSWLEIEYLKRSA